MGMKNIIENVVSSKLKSPIVDVLKDIKIDKLLKQSKIVKKEGTAPSAILLHFISIIVMNTKLSTFMKQSSESFKKDVYYDALKNPKYNWQKLLLLLSFSMIQKVNNLKQKSRIRVFIIDDTNEDKTGKKIEGVCDSLRSNKHKRYIRGINMVSLNYNDGFTNFMLDFSLKFTKKLKVNTNKFKNQFYHTTSAYKRKKEASLQKIQLQTKLNKKLQQIAFLGKHNLYLVKSDNSSTIP